MLNPVVQLQTAFIQDWESLGIWEWQEHIFINSADCNFWIKVFLVLFWGCLLIPIHFDPITFIVMFKAFWIMLINKVLNFGLCLGLLD